MALRASAWVELHAWLAAAGRGARETGEPALDPATKAYARVLADDDADELLGRTTHALEACDDERCARAAVTGTPFATPYLEALPGFLERDWTSRATIARDGIERARAAIGPEVEALADRLAKDLALDWPTEPPRVDVVSEAPEPGRDAPVRVLMAARGACFLTEKGETSRMHDARVIDCALSYALLGMRERSALGAALPDARAWTAVVVHAVAVVVTAWEPRHVSGLRRSAKVVMPEAMDWLASEWPARLRGEPANAFAKRYVAALAEPPP